MNLRALVRAIRHGLSKPDAFARDWYGWVTNQGSHGSLIGWPIGIMLMFLLHPIAAIVIGTVGYFILVERLWQGGVDLRDDLEDTYHVGAGISMLAVPMLAVPEKVQGETLMMMGLCYLIWLVVLSRGIFRRL